MGRAYEAVSVLLTAFFLILPFSSRMKAQEIGAHARIRSFTMPQYNEKDGRLQFIVYGKGADNKGAILLLDDMVIDFIRNGLEDVSTVRMLPEVQPLPLNASADDIRKFWKGKEHSQGFVFADAAVLDKNIQVLRSDKPVRFRSPMLDVDGVGFDAYQSRKFLHIRSKVILKIWPAARRQSGIGMDRASSGEKKSAGDYYEQEIKQQSNTKKKE